MSPRHSRRSTLGFTLLTLSGLTGAAAGQVGTNYCTPVANSTGSAASIAGSGSAVVPWNDLVLTSSGLPQNSAAFFLCSQVQGFGANPGGSAGNVCLGNPIGRGVGGMILNSGATGVVSIAANLNAMPQPGGALIVQPGETWNFQCWYRDVVGGNVTSNFSDGLEVLFTVPPPPAPGMVGVNGGVFVMGSTASSSWPYYSLADERPAPQVTLTYDFWIGQHEVTQAEYQALMGSNPSTFVGATLPVESVSWDDARAYCAALTAQEASLGAVPPGYEYRLPTEAEWEYSCRAGTTTEFHYGPMLFCGDARIWLSHHSNAPHTCGVSTSAGTVPVESYVPNAFGLYDMHGNVYEWCLDSYAAYPNTDVTDRFVTGSNVRVARGGAWFSSSSSCRSASRLDVQQDFHNYGIGFRVVLGPVLVP